jgi:hypothetical protein
MSVQFTPAEQAFRALVVRRLAEAMRPCLDEAVGKNIRERAAWMIPSGEMIKLASLYTIQLGSTAEEISARPRDCFNEALSLSREKLEALINRCPLATSAHIHCIPLPTHQLWAWPCYRPSTG